MIQKIYVGFDKLTMDMFSLGLAGNTVKWWKHWPQMLPLFWNRLWTTVGKEVAPKHHHGHICHRHPAFSYEYSCAPCRTAALSLEGFWSLCWDGVNVFILGVILNCREYCRMRIKPTKMYHFFLIFGWFLELIF